MKKTWKHIIAGIIATATIYPINAHADQGVMLNSTDVQDEQGNLIQTFEKGKRIQMVGESQDTYSVSIDHQRYFVDKKSVLKTMDEEEASISIKGGNEPLRLIPSLFRQPIQALSKGEVVQRVKDGLYNDEYWIKVETKEGIIGFIYRDSVEINYNKTESYTKTFISQEGTQNEKYFEYGQEVLLSDYRDGAFVVKEGETEYLLPESQVSFEKPSKPLILTPSDTFPEQLKVYGSPQYIPPVNMKTPPVSSRFGMRWGKLHGGTDIAVPIGTPIFAVADGQVIVSVKNQGSSHRSWGNYVKIKHDGVNDTLYGHMSRPIVSNGQQVKQGQLIGYSGNSGHSTGPHIHFEFYQNGVRIDSYFIVNQPELHR
jgi:murein DD-endopeptidase MepM/ murein hydrolase activator NlpD